jgi:hypothetical protein
MLFRKELKYMKSEVNRPIKEAESHFKKCIGR